MLHELATEQPNPDAPPDRSARADLPTAQIAELGSDPARLGRPKLAPDPVGTPVSLFPEPGDRFLGFEILSELGRGAMGRVFLARQPAPVDRQVVLKIGPHLSSECKRLSKLQHPNVVPVYSFHQDEWVQAVCMPYRGPVTLAHLVARLRAADFQTLDGKLLTTAIEQCRQLHRSAVPTAAPQPAAEPAPTAPEQSEHLFQELRGLNYIDAVLTLIRQVADGLRAAHAERIVHCDLKPANVLIADDGCAQLIDFGVAYDKSDAVSQGRLGGTRPYMSPEQLRSFALATLEHDERSDLYAVGVMLYELLTGRVPFEPLLGGCPETLERERRTRFAGAAPVRAHNPRVPHAVAAIIGKCLAPDLAARYQTAGQLLEDLDRQIARRPLRFAPNPSVRERAANFAFRNRLLLAATGLVGLTGLAFAGFAHRDARRADQITRLEAVAAGEPFAADLEDAEFAFGLSDGDPVQRERARAGARRALDRFRAWDDADWFRRAEYQALEPARLDAHRRQVAGLMLLVANSFAQEACASAPAARADLIERAGAWNRRAEETHPSADGCRAVWTQRGFLRRLAGDPAGAERFNRRAEAVPQSAADAVLEGRQLVTEGRVPAALDVLKDGTRADPKSFWAAYYAAVCHQTLGHEHEAAAGYDICHSLRPGFFGTYFNRGQVLLRLGRAPDAEADFDRALAARPDWADAHFQRGIAREVRGRYTDAIEDLNRALELGYTPTSVYLVRSRVYGRLGNKSAAERDCAEGIKLVPTDERGWLARAQARLFRDPTAALADYDAALKLNPRSVHALQGQAHLLHRAEKYDGAAQALTRLIDINPDVADAWAGRGVLRAQLNDRAGALADAREALRLTEAPATKYQVAGIYAMTSRTHPEDRREAFSLLDTALRAGFGFDYLKDDRELDPIRTDPEFQKTVDAARKYRDALKKRD